MWTIIRSIAEFYAVLVFFFAGFIMLCIAIERFYFGIPAGVSLIDYSVASVDGGYITSPSGDHRLRVNFNDAGAAHSGAHWTWVIREYPFGYKRVVAEGYLFNPKELPVEWIDEHTCEFTFESERHGSPTPKKVRYRF